MKKLIALLALVLATTVAVLITTSSAVARTTSTCAVGTYEATFSHTGGPPVGSPASTSLDDKNDVLHGSGSDVRGMIRVSGASHTLIAGILNTGAGPHAYLEADGVFKSQTTVLRNNNYSLGVENLGSNVYQAYYVAGGSRKSTNLTITTPDQTEFVGHSHTGTAGTCNTIDFIFSSITPWTTGQMILNPSPTGYPGVSYNTNLIEYLGS